MMNMPPAPPAPPAAPPAPGPKTAGELALERARRKKKRGFKTAQEIKDEIARGVDPKTGD